MAHLRVLVGGLLTLGVVLVTGALLEHAYSIPLLTRSSVMALSWLAIGPWLFADAIRLSKSFLRSYQSAFPSVERWNEVLATHLQRLSQGWWQFGIPWSAFALPVFEIKRFADSERMRVTAAARAKLESLIDEYSRRRDHDEQLARRIEFCYQMECVELSGLKEYPYDLKVILELLLAVAVPLAVVLIQIFWE